MNKELMRKAGFTKEVADVEFGHCPFCGKVLVGLFVAGIDDTEVQNFVTLFLLRSTRFLDYVRIVRTTFLKPNERGYHGRI